MRLLKASKKTKVSSLTQAIAADLQAKQAVQVRAIGKEAAAVMVYAVASLQGAFFEQAPKTDVIWQHISTPEKGETSMIMMTVYPPTKTN